MNKFVVVVFPDESKANEGAKALQDLHAEGILTLHGLAVARKEPGGELAVTEKKDRSLPGAAAGALVGGLVGLLGGPGAAALGAAGGAWIGTWRDISRLGVGTEFLQEVADALAPDTVAVIADVTEDRVAPLDERMDALGGVVLREWQSAFSEVELATEAAARKTELEHLEAERREASSEARRRLLDLRIDKAEAKLQDVADRARTRLTELERSYDERLDTLARQAEASGGGAKASVERRLAETRAERDRRTALVEQTIETAAAALP